MSLPVACAAPSISQRLARTLAVLMLAGLGTASAIIYSATAMRLHDAQRDTLTDKTKVLSEFVAAACEKGGEPELLDKLRFFEPVRAGTQLNLQRGDGSALFTQALGLELDLIARGMGVRMNRFSMLVKDGKVTSLNVEAPGKFEVSDAATLLAQAKSAKAG